MHIALFFVFALSLLFPASSFSQQPPLSINITSPVNGSAVPAGQLLVSGTIQAPQGEVGVTVNGVQAGVQGNTFASVVGVTTETTSLTATAAAVNGATASTSVSVSVTGTADWQLNATPTSGISPLTVRFSLFTERAITQVSLDADGDGVVDYSGTKLDQEPFVFFQPGVYVATVTVTDSQGTQSTVNAVIQAFDQNALNGSLTIKWADFKATLTASDIEGALLFVANGAKDKYRGVFQALAPNLPAIAAELQDLTSTLIGNGIMGYGTTRQLNGQTFVYFVYFMVDQDGVWKIVAM